MTTPLWRPSDEKIASTNLTAFVRFLEERTGQVFDGYPALHRFSVDQMDAFWGAVWEFCGVIAAFRGGPVLINPTKMPGARFFPETK